MGFFERIGFNKKEQLEQSAEATRKGLLSKIGKAFVGKSTIDASFLDELESILISSDVGVKTTLAIIERIEKRASKDKYLTEDDLHHMLRDEIAELLETKQQSGKSAEIKTKPHVILVVGVNGVGKTTTIGKLANFYKSQGKSVLLGAADTFRAAAVNQLIIWSERAGVPIVQQGQNADPAAVAYDTVSSGVSKDVDVIIIDTAGRLHNKKSLMEELAKIGRVLKKVVPEAPHEVLLILDASTGQNAIQQARAFMEAVTITGLIVTKLDGTAKGGVVIGISHELNVPVTFIGTGEKIEDIQPFDASAFVQAIFK